MQVLCYNFAAMSNEVVLDIETQDAAGWDHKLMRISVVGCYFYDGDEYVAYTEDELPKLWQRLEQSGRIIGFNNKYFDFPVMNNYYPGDFLTFPTLDLLEVITGSLGFRVKLDHVAHGTIGYGKSGHGLDAVEWWKRGEVEKIKKYCLDDVKVTKEVYEFGKTYGIVRFYDRLGVLHEVPVDFKGAEVQPSKINLTMGL